MTSAIIYLMNSKATIFEFTTYKLNQENNTLSFHYTIHFTEGTKLDLTEKLILPVEKIDFNTVPSLLLDTCLQNLHIMNGVNYWKLYCPPEIKIQNNFLNKQQAEFWNAIYGIGMGEFYYRNNIDFRSLVKFPYINNSASSVSFPRNDRSLIGIGGGKDSIVAYQLLKKAKEEMTGFIVSHGTDSTVVEGVVQLMEINTFRIKRVFDPQLMELNKKEDTYNGHVPVSAIFAFIGILLGVLYDYKYVVVSNERSAESGNIEWNGYTINHQWSKSKEFENLFRQYVSSFITPDVTYFSLLRPYTELKIVELFSQYKKYFPYFSSCNRNFRINIENKALWCGECAKCAFVYGLLSAFISKEELMQIFGKNLFAQESLIPMYKDLLGVGSMKPFDCVGPFEETQVAMYLANRGGKYSGDVVMELYENEVLPRIRNIDELKVEEFRVGDIDSIPEKFRKVV